MQSSEILCHVALIITDILQECIASIIMVTRIGKLGMLAVISNQSTLQSRLQVFSNMLIQEIIIVSVGESCSCS
jgi:hypothetical protein